ncbi:hypothetical protein BTR23_10765 [Alkalihalophilus pseudofirmus]|nr:hypothetical protein BTR23_10765 [Alkalihalophilus pseudofirmus]
MRRKSVVVPGLHHGGQPIPVASVVDNILISGGIMGMDPENGEIPEDIQSQCKLMFENVHRVMESAGGSMDDIVRFTIFLRDNANRNVVNEDWLRYFPDESSRPARISNQRELPKPLHVQCEIYAVLENN